MARATGRVAVTGATGFLGRRLVPALIARGWRTRVLARRADATTWDGEAPEVVLGDLGDPAALDALAIGVDVVIHAAGLVKAGNRDAFFAVNRDGAARLAAATEGRMLLVSSLAAREPALSDYAASKRAGEAAARDILGDRLMVVRPTAIYGPGDRATLDLFRVAADSPIMPMPDSADARLALAHVDDVAAYVIDRLEGAWTSGTYAMGGARPEGYDWREIFTTAAAAVGRAPLIVPTPGWVIRGAAALAEAVGTLRGAPTMFNRGKAR
jgi:uncharacterized protein YbjT (DUF2867 family)